MSGATTRALALFFGRDDVPFSITSAHPLVVQKTRTYQRFSDAAADVVNARIYVGIHFRTADLAARRQGMSVAEWAFKHFHPFSDDNDDDDDDDGGGGGGDHEH